MGEQQMLRCALSKVMQALKGRRGTACRTLGPRHSQAEGYGKPYPYSHRGSRNEAA